MIIYIVKNKRNGKCYVGQTLRPFRTRKAEHLQAAANIARTKHPAPLHKAINELGSGEFEWEILEQCTSINHMHERERFYIKLLNTQYPHGYNQTIGGAIDESMSLEVREKIAASVVKLHQDPEYRSKVYPKLKGLVPPNKGIPMSEEQKLKVSKARKAVHEDPTYVNPNVGQKRTGQALENLKQAYELRVLPTGEAWHESHKNQYTPEVRQKMREKKLGKKPANTKKVLCIDTGQIFDGLTEASKALNVNRQSIFLQIKGKLKRAGGLTFAYVEASV